LHAAFIDIKKAFPSVSRPILFERLIQLGVPWPLVWAIRSFYVCNRTRLRVGNFLSRFFVVTVGLLEGSILSPILFSIVISVVWTIVQPCAFPGPENIVFQRDGVWVLAFADDLVILSPSREKLASVLIALDSELTKLNLYMNLAKTEVMTFIPAGRSTRVTPGGEIVIRSKALAEVASFRYLGVVLTKTGSFTQHLDLIVSRALAAVHRTSDLILDLAITDLGRMRCYYSAFVRAQFYGLELIPFTHDFISRFQLARSVFMRRVFRLPPGTPSDLFYILFPSLRPALVCLRQRFSFYKRVLRHDLICVPDALLFDATVLMGRSCGWFYESFCFYREVYPNARVSEFDFERDVGAVLSLVNDEDAYSFLIARESRGSSLSFFREITSARGLESFRRDFSLLSSPYQHIVLCFASNQIRWCFLSYVCRTCPLCKSSSWYWEHFLRCPALVQTLSSRNLSFALFRAHIQSSRWKVVFREIAHVLLVWSFALNADPTVTLSYDTDVFRCMIRDI
jgi:hypothetical protein